MNPINGMPGPSSLWQEARNADGRVYYYNVQTKITQWGKPPELMTPVEVRAYPILLPQLIADISLASIIQSAMEGIHC
jgi:WW domain